MLDVAAAVGEAAVDAAATDGSEVLGVLDVEVEEAGVAEEASEDTELDKDAKALVEVGVNELCVKLSRMEVTCVKMP